MSYTDGLHLRGVSFAQKSCSAKLAPQKVVPTGAPKGKKQTRPIAVGPFCASTYVSISKTCPSTCTFRDNGCYAQTGSSRRIMQRLDREALEGNVIRNEARLIRESFGGRFGRMVPQDGARGGRDLRLHVGGDTDGAEGAERLSAAAEQWRKRGGGVVWTYTHRWREIPAESWGGVAVWASCETADDVRAAQALGYRASMVVLEHPSERMYTLGGLRVLPCPFETRGKTCVECRLCLDAPIDPRAVIGFAVHGQGAKVAKRRLRVLNAISPST